MSLPEGLYDRFLQGQCTAEEEATVLTYFREHPDAWDQYLQHKDFISFKADAHLHPAVTANMLQHIQSHIRQQQQRRRIRRISAVAAAFIGGLCCVGIWWQQHTKPVVAPVLASLFTSATDTIENTSGHSQRLELADGSVVHLYKHSRLVFNKGLHASQREIFLTGGGRFSVAKDVRPFTVYTRTLATTALGTVFSVAENATPDHRVDVQLISGKIVVKSRTGDNAFAPVYMQPGQSLSFSNAMKQPATQTRRALPVIPAGVENMVVDEQTLVFNHVPLQKVLGVLSDQYAADIKYDTYRFRKVFVTATFSRQDSLIDILETIATMNNASVQQGEDRHYQLKK